MHWINAVCVVILLMSGLQIFNAHPSLYWGKASDFDRPLLRIGDDYEHGRPVGFTTVLGRRFVTTGVLGWSTIGGEGVPRAFPAWVTIPRWQDLATGRVWHFFFAWAFAIDGLLYLGYALFARHLQRDLLPSRAELRGFGRSLHDHLRFKFSPEVQARRYNVLQKLSYLAVVLVLLPLAALTGLTLSPGVDAAAPWLLHVFAGRQSARTLHFVVAWLIVGFVFVHVLMVLASGWIDNLRAMITGRHALEPGPAGPSAAEGDPDAEQP